MACSFPENLEYRVLLMHAYFRTTRHMELLALLKQTDAFFHEKDRWNEHAMARLAQSTLQNELYEQSVGYFKELIPLHERTQQGRGIGNGILAGYRRPTRVTAIAGRIATLETMLLSGIGLQALGGLMLLLVAVGWVGRHFGPAASIVPPVLGTLAIALGTQNIMGGFLMAIIGGNEARFFQGRHSDKSHEDQEERT